MSTAKSPLLSYETERLASVELAYINLQARVYEVGHLKVIDHMLLRVQLGS